MNQQTKSNSIWQKTAMVCLFLSWFINFGNLLSDNVQSVLVLMLVLICLASSIMWIRNDNKNNVPDKYKAQLLVVFMGIALLILIINYFVVK